MKKIHAITRRPKQNTKKMPYKNFLESVRISFINYTPNHDNVQGDKKSKHQYLSSQASLRMKGSYKIDNLCKSLSDYMIIGNLKATHRKQPAERCLVMIQIQSHLSQLN